MNLNRVFLAGHITRDIDLRTTQSGKQVAKFGMAVNREWTQDGVKKQEVCYVDLTAFGRPAEVLNQHLRKGSPLFVEGRLDFQSWQDKEGGKHSKLAVVVEHFQFIGDRAPRPKADQQQPDGSGPAPERATQAEYGDIPF